MIIQADAYLARHRRPILIGAAVLVFLPVNPSVLLIAAPALVLLSVLSSDRPAFRRRPALPGFASPRRGAPVLVAAAHFAAIGGCFAAGRHDPARAAWVVLLIAVLTPLPFYLYGVWHGTGITLTPSGIAATKLTGAVFVPWSALEPVQHLPNRTGALVLRLTAEAAIVRVSGRPLERDVITFDRVQPEYLATVIAHYAANPAQRAEISPGGDPAIGDEPVELVPLPRRPVARSVVAGALLAVAAVPLFAWTFDRLDGHGRLEDLTDVFILAEFFGLGLIVKPFLDNHTPTPPAADPPPPARPPWSRDVSEG